MIAMKPDVRRLSVLQQPILLLLSTVALFEDAALQAQPDLVAVSRAVGDLAAWGISAGVVVRLTGTSSEDVSPFDALLSMGRRMPEPLDKQLSAKQLLETRLGKERLNDVNGVPLYIDPTAPACNRLLDASIVLSGSRGMMGTVVAAFNQVAGQSVAEGAMGTCLPVAFTKSRRGTEKPSVLVGSLKEVLTAAAASEPGTVWVAVAAPDGTCTIGLVLQAEKGGTCRVQIGSPVKVIQ